MPTDPLVLVVDDYADAREMYGESLLASGFRVAEATNGAEAIEKAGTLNPDVILMDLSLPGVDGWEATRLAGCDRGVIKPALPDEVVQEVRKALRN